MGEWSQHAGSGIQYAITLLIFVLGGLKLDEWMDSEPVGLLIAALLGFVGATVSLVKKYSPFDSSKKSPSRSTKSDSKN